MEPTTARQFHQQPGTPSYASQSSAPTPLSPIQDSRHALSESLTLLHDRVGLLEQRLEPLCIPTAPTPASGNEKEARIPSEYRIYLLERNAEVRAAISRLESLLARLEI